MAMREAGVRGGKCLGGGEASATGETKQAGLEGLARHLGFPRGPWGATAGSGAGAGQVCAVERALWLPGVPRRREVFGIRAGAAHSFGGRTGGKGEETASARTPLQVLPGFSQATCSPSVWESSASSAAS